MSDAANACGTGRVILLLQGPCSWFFTRLARALGARGARVLRVLFCPGDALFWRGPGAHVFRGRAEDWPGWFSAFCRREGVSDIVCLGDGRALHADAIGEARGLGLRVHVVEQGYLRPGWLTVEPGGTGGRSRLPRDPVAYRGAGRAGMPPAPAFRAGFAGYAAMDVAWNLANLLAAWAFFPHYRGHALDPPLREWSGWIGKALRRRATRRRVAEVMARLADHRGPVFLLPLQLETDFQIRLHGPTGGQRPLLRRVVRDFAAHAAADALLVVKRHPLDNGLTPWRAMLRKAAAEARVENRVAFLPAGDIETCLRRSAGVLTVNSTVGLTALRAGLPVIALGRAVYDLPGLTHRGELSGFWRAPTPPDAELLRDFVAYLARTIQVPGGFDGAGAAPGADAMAERILAPAPF
jgi:capsular polysaccharide export protein